MMHLLSSASSPALTFAAARQRPVGVPPTRLARLFFVTVILSTLLLDACASPPPAAPPRGVDELERRLADAAASVSAAMAKLAVVEQSARAVYAQAITPADIPADLQLKVNVDYQGDLRPLVQQLARTVGYDLKTYGRPAQVTPVTVVSEARPVGEILADVGYQASYRADVVVIPPRKIIEIRYVRDAHRVKKTRRRSP